MKNKGQILVAFIILIPTLIFIVTSIVELGNLSYQKKEINNKIERIIEDTFNNNLTEEETKKLIKANLNQIEIKYYEQTNDKLEITIKLNLNSILGKNKINYEPTYVGKIQEGNLKIVRK